MRRQDLAASASALKFTVSWAAFAWSVTFSGAPVEAKNSVTPSVVVVTHTHTVPPGVPVNA